jgi:hypothetical protein
MVSRCRNSRDWEEYVVFNFKPQALSAIIRFWRQGIGSLLPSNVHAGQPH